MATTPPKVNFDLDTVEDGPGPYVFTAGGEVFTTRDPAGLDWKELAALDPDNAFEVLETVFETEEYERFLKVKVSGRKLAALMEKLTDHYQLSGTRRGNRRGSRIS
jgi:hypothetical protein